MKSVSLKIRFGTFLSADIQIEIGGKIWGRIDVDTPQGSHQTPWLHRSFGLDELLVKAYSASKSASLRVSSSAWINSFVDILPPLRKEYTTRRTPLSPKSAHMRLRRSFCCL